MAIRAVADGGREAVTFYEVVERFRGFALVRCKPQTGRTHQIRVHLTHIGHPILADKQYSGRDRITLGDLLPHGTPAPVDFEPDKVLIERQALHAHSLQIVHPLSGQEIRFQADLPEDMAQTLAALRTLRPLA
jgi:23S rRNA pseudouridine1911/1915/1917 synthase